MRKKGLLTKAALLTVLLFSMVFIFTGCKKDEKKGERNDIEFTVCSRDMLPEELYAIIEEKKENVSKFTYANGSYMYIVVCYGEKERENLNVVVNDLFMTSNAIYIDTTLKTDKTSATDAVGVGELSMYPYIVLKCDKYDLPVVFDID